MLACAPKPPRSFAHDFITSARRKERHTSTIPFPLGPYHQALTQPLGLTLRLRAETIAGVEPIETGYCHRGIAELVEGATLDDALAVIERSCSLAGTAHRLAFCQAVEAATGASVAPAARLTRVLFAELERVLARLWLLATISRAAGQSATFRDALEQREALFAALESATGQRRYWAATEPGGVRDDLDLEPLEHALTELVPALEVWRAAVGPNGPLGRAGQGVGILSAERAEALGLAGIAAAGSGVVSDLRRDEPYSGYSDLEDEWPTIHEEAGDVAARMRAAVADIAHSLDLAIAASQHLSELSVSSGAATKLKPPSAPTEASSQVEGPHGPVTLTLTLAPDLTVSHLQLSTPAAAALAAVPEALESRLVAQAPAILASLDLCMECLDQ